MAVEIALPDVLAEAVDLVGEDAVIPQASSWRPRYDGSAADSIGESGPNPQGTRRLPAQPSSSRAGDRAA